MPALACSLVSPRHPSRCRQHLFGSTHDTHAAQVRLRAAAAEHDARGFSLRMGIIMAGLTTGPFAQSAAIMLLLTTTSTPCRCV